MTKATWTQSKLEIAYRRIMLHDFLRDHHVMRILRLQLPKGLTGPVQAPTMPMNKLEAATDLLRLAQEAVLTVGAFEAKDLFGLELDTIRFAAATLFNKLKPIVGEKEAPEPTRPNQAKEDQATTHGYHTGSSTYESATSEVGSDSSTEPKRMSLGLAGTELLRNKATAEISREKTTWPTQTPTQTLNRPAKADPPHESTSPLERYFQSAMDRFLQERSLTPVPRTRPTTTRWNKSAATYAGTQDVDMESVGSRDHPENLEYDPDDLGTAGTRILAATAATTTATPAAGTAMIQRVRISAISDLKEFTGKDDDEERARAWISKVKSAFTRDQAPDEEKCLTFADLLTGPARNWYRQLSRSTRTKWVDLVKELQSQYCGLGVSVAWQYYHARKRSDESPQEYLHRLNVAGMRARVGIKDGDAKARREHVEHFIETLGDPEFADQLTLLRLSDAEELEEVLRARERSKSRHKKLAGGNKFRPKPVAAPQPSAPARPVRAMHLPTSDRESDTDESGSESELHRAYVAAASGTPSAEPTPATGDHPTSLTTNQPVADSNVQDHRPRYPNDGQRCSHCGSRKHSDLGCWKRIICQKCGKKGHPSDQCFFVCRGCGELHDHGKCQMEEFYNLIRQWFDPSKHPGFLPEAAEKMLN